VLAASDDERFRERSSHYSIEVERVGARPAMSGVGDGKIPAVGVSAPQPALSQIDGRLADLGAEFLPCHTSARLMSNDSQSEWRSRKNISATLAMRSCKRRNSTGVSPEQMHSANSVASIEDSQRRKCPIFLWTSLLVARNGEDEQAEGVGWRSR